MTERASEKKLKKWPVSLECGHELLYVTPVPQGGDTLWCKRCQRYQLVTKKPRKSRRQAAVTV